MTLTVRKVRDWFILQWLEEFKLCNICAQKKNPELAGEHTITTTKSERLVRLGLTSLKRLNASHFIRAMCKMCSRRYLDRESQSVINNPSLTGIYTKE